VGRTLAVVVLCALVLSGAAVAGEPGFAPVEPASPNAERINDSYYWVAIFTGAIFVLVQGTLVWFIVRYRADRRTREMDGAQVHGNTNLELAWTVAPVLILVAIGSFIFYKLPGIQDVPAADRVEVSVKGYRYYWNFTYPNGVIAVDKLRAPVGQTTRLAVSAPDFDVIHSWWIPALGGKFDAIPGMTNETWFNPKAPGTYRGQCAEFCGIQHAVMRAEVEAMPREEFDAWLADEAEAQAAGTSELGEETYRGACAKCHGLAGEGDIGRKLLGNRLLADSAAVEHIVRNGRAGRRGQPGMPPVGKDWEERQMTALTDYLEEELLGG
jgi:cytochrome c oxidase subunit 2